MDLEAQNKVVFHLRVECPFGALCYGRAGYSISIAEKMKAEQFGTRLRHQLSKI